MLGALLSPTPGSHERQRPHRAAHAGEVEYRNLTEKELALCTRAAMPGGLRLKDADMDLVEALHKKGLLYLEVPIRPDDHVSIPPLEVLRPHAQSAPEGLRGIAHMA